MTLYPASLRQFLAALRPRHWARRGCPICSATTHDADFHTAHEQAQFCEMRSSR